MQECEDLSANIHAYRKVSNSYATLFMTRGFHAFGPAQVWNSELCWQKRAGKASRHPGSEVNMHAIMDAILQQQSALSGPVGHIQLTGWSLGFVSRRDLLQHHATNT